MTDSPQPIGRSTVCDELLIDHQIHERRVLIIDSITELYGCLLANVPGLYKLQTNSNSDSKLLDQLLQSILHPAMLSIQVPVVHQRSDKEIGSYDDIRNNLTIPQYLEQLRQGNRVYLKDWHYLRDFHANLPVNHDIFPSLAAFQSILPSQILCDDWLNWYYIQYLDHSDDYTFLYCGSNHTATGLHHDVCCSYSYSVNLHGHKRWYLWHPSDIYRAATTFNHLHRYCSDEGGIVDLIGFLIDNHSDSFTQYLLASQSAYEVIQQPNELIFVPSGWYHVVINSNGDLGPSVSVPSDDISLLQDSYILSINTNSFNALNVLEIYQFMLKDMNMIYNDFIYLLDTGKPSEDGLPLMSPEEWSCHCDLILKSNSAINFFHFFTLLAARIAVMIVCIDKDMGLVERGLWREIFCPQFDLRMVTDTDREIITSQYHSQEVYSCEQRKNSLSMCWKGTQDWSTMPADSSIRSSRIWDISCSNLSRIYRHMLSQSFLLQHLSCVFKHPVDSIEEAMRGLCYLLQKIQSHQQ